MFKIVGKTQDGRDVVSGVFRFYESVGLPLDIILDTIRENNTIPDWTAFYKEAKAAGMKHDRIISKLEESIMDVYGVEFQKIVCQTLENLYRAGVI